MRILFVTYYWPPSGRASLHWPLAMIKNFPKFDLEPVVLTINEDRFSQKDASLLCLIDEKLKIYKSNSLDPFSIYKKFIGKRIDEPLVSSEVISKENKSFAHKISLWIRMNLFIPDARVGWYFSAMRKGKFIYKENKYDAVVSVGPPHSSHLIGKSLSKKYSIPHIPVLIDPWTDIAYYKGFKRSKATLCLDNYFEKTVLDNSRHIIFVTKTTQNDFSNKYDFVKNKSSVLYWGFNEEDFERLNIINNAREEKIILHAGNIFDYQNPIALWKNIKSEIDKGTKFRLRFVGTVSPAIRQSIKDYGLENITNFVGFIPYKNVLEEMMSADYLFVCASEPRHTPGKLFEYLRTGKKIIAFNDENYEVQDILNEGNSGIQLPYNYDKNDIFKKLKNIKPNNSFSRKYNRSKIAEEFAGIIKSNL